MQRARGVCQPQTGTLGRAGFVGVFQDVARQHDPADDGTRRVAERIEGVLAGVQAVVARAEWGLDPQRLAGYYLRVRREAQLLVV